MPRVLVSKINSNGQYESLVESSGRDKAALADMLVNQRAPRVSTDSTFMAGYSTGHNDNVVGDSATKIRRMYEKATGSRPSGKFYNSQLARYVGDPEAWVGSKSELAELCKKRGVGYVGAVNVEAPEVAPKPEITPDTYTCAPDIVNKRIAAMERENPGSVTSLSKKERKELREKVTKVASGRR